MKLTGIHVQKNNLLQSLIKLGLAISLLGLVPVIAIFILSFPADFFGGASDYPGISYYSVAAPLFIILFPVLLAFLPKISGRRISTPVLTTTFLVFAVGFIFMAPIIPQTFYIVPCRAYNTQWESVGYYFLGRGFHYLTFLFDCFS